MSTTWKKGIEIKAHPELKDDITADAVIIGAGLAGTLAAYKLKNSGKKVVVLERKSSDRGITAHTTAFLTYVIDTGLDELEKMFGKDRAKAVWESHRWAIDEIEKIVREEKIDCEFMRCPNYVYASTEAEWDNIQSESKTARELGFPVSLRKESQFPFENHGYYHVPDQAKFHPLKFLKAIRQEAFDAGIWFFDHTEAQKIEEKDEKQIVKTENGSVAADFVLVSTYDPFNRPKELLLHRGTYVSYILELAIPKNILSEGLYEDMQNPYHYFRVDSCGDHDRMIIGGEDHRHEIPGMRNKAFEALEFYVKRIMPRLQYKIVEEWDGPILETIDGLAYIGRLKEESDQFVATGFSGNGMTYSMIAAQIFTDGVMGKKNTWEEVYSPQRKTTMYNLAQKGKDYVEELYQGAVKTIIGRRKK